MRVIKVNMDRRRNEGAGEAGYPPENPPINGIVRHDSHLRNPGHQLMTSSAERCCVPSGGKKNRLQDAEGVAVAERLDCSPPTKENLVQSPARRCRWLRDLDTPAQLFWRHSPMGRVTRLGPRLYKTVTMAARGHLASARPSDTLKEDHQASGPRSTPSSAAVERGLLVVAYDNVQDHLYNCTKGSQGQNYKIDSDCQPNLRRNDDLVSCSRTSHCGLCFQRGHIIDEDYNDDNGLVPDDVAGLLVFSGILAPPVHCSATPYSSRFTLIGSRDLDVKSRPDIFTHWTGISIGIKRDTKKVEGRNMFFDIILPMVRNLG
ncbi:hypothetical protein PR048_030296 [Dryococelus australis]|uniref:Uncharacterized protein n=1 Tax=Dryococelus australis TaxID=614101 RepID=A0ABQ9GCG4_9NEOP|nr:hypothetical protein PR048_030296 [Dryococelus australis]